MAQRIIAYVSDLLFSSRIQATLAPGGYVVSVVEDLKALERELTESEVALVILDLHAGVSAENVVADTLPLSVPVLAFGRHTEPALLRAARNAGCAEVVPRSTFVEEMPSLVRRLIDHPESAEAVLGDSESESVNR